MLQLILPPRCNSLPCQVWWPWAWQQGGYNVFSGCRARFYMLAYIRHYYLSLQHIARHSVIHKIQNVGLAICNVMLISSILVTRGYSNHRKNFCHSVQICCREKEKVEYNGNCKVFPVTCKGNKLQKIRVNILRKVQNKNVLIALKSRFDVPYFV